MLPSFTHACTFAILHSIISLDFMESHYFQNRYINVYKHIVIFKRSDRSHVFACAQDRHTLCNQSIQYATVGDFNVRPLMKYRESLFSMILSTYIAYINNFLGPFFFCTWMPIVLLSD